MELTDTPKQWRQEIRAISKSVRLRKRIYSLRADEYPLYPPFPIISFVVSASRSAVFYCMEMIDDYDITRRWSFVYDVGLSQFCFRSLRIVLADGLGLRSSEAISDERVGSFFIRTLDGGLVGWPVS